MTQTISYSIIWSVIWSSNYWSNNNQTIDIITTFCPINNLWLRALIIDGELQHGYLCMNNINTSTSPFIVICLFPSVPDPPLITSPHESPDSSEYSLTWEVASRHVYEYIIKWRKVTNLSNTITLFSWSPPMCH